VFLSAILPPVFVLYYLFIKQISSSLPVPHFPPTVPVTDNCHTVTVLQFLLTRTETSPPNRTALFFPSKVPIAAMLLDEKNFRDYSTLLYNYVNNALVLQAF
jgi:hypothetical protein